MKQLMKYLPVSFLLFLTACSNEVENSGEQRFIAPGIGLGSVVAVVISWDRNKSILWAIIHGLFGWFYVIYALLFSKKAS
jgi:branched-subunit amino acid transport protein